MSSTEAYNRKLALVILTTSNLSKAIFAYGQGDLATVIDTTVFDPNAAAIETVAAIGKTMSN